MGGEARLGETDGKAVGNALRTLFLHTRPTDPSRSPGLGNEWRTPGFESERIQMGLSPSAAAAVREIRAGTFDEAAGTLTWSGEVAKTVWKRDTQLLRKWMGLSDRPPHEQLVRGLYVFLTPPADASSSMLLALGLFVRAGPEPLTGPVGSHPVP